MSDFLEGTATTTQAGHELGTAGQSVSNRRRVGAVFFGFVYGLTLLDGVSAGIGYVLGNNDYAVGQTPYLRETLYLLSIIMMGTLACYVGRSVSLGVIAAAMGSALCIAVPRLSLSEPSHRSRHG